MLQAEALDALLGGAPLIVDAHLGRDEAIVRRLGNRRICESCTITQSVFVASEGENDSCPYCGGRLVRRQDDEPEVVRRRLATYASFAEPLIAYYRARPRSPLSTASSRQRRHRGDRRPHRAAARAAAGVDRLS